MSKSVFKPEIVKMTNFQNSMYDFAKKPKISVFCTFQRFSAASACNAFLPFFGIGDREYSILALSRTKNIEIHCIEKNLSNFQF